MQHLGPTGDFSQEPVLDFLWLGTNSPIVMYPGKKAMGGQVAAIVQTGGAESDGRGLEVCRKEGLQCEH